MPLIKLKHVVSCSSEDTNNPSENLLQEEVYRKWKGANAGEKQLAAVIQLEKSTLIRSVDIGNEGSAFVEVLVGRSSASTSEEFQVLLVASAFMSPGESKSWTNTSRVRMFGKEKLSKSVVDQKWDLIKVVCTQPFNKKEQFGLSFVRFTSPPEKADQELGTEGGGTSSSPSTSSKKIGAFSLREEEPVPSSGNLLFRKDSLGKEGSQGSFTSSSSSKTQEMSVAAHARAASLSALREKAKEEKEEERQRKGGERKTESKGNGDRFNSSSAKSKPHPSSSRGSSSVSSFSSSTGVKRPTTSSTLPAKPKRKKKERKVKDFGSLLSKVTFVLSGFKNPFRGELRDKAVAMGATYETDWGPNSTHLVCAFHSTPKFSEVKKKGGLIVKKEWVLDCYKQKTRLSTKPYRLVAGDNRSTSDDDSSDSEDEEEKQQTAPPVAEAVKIETKQGSTPKKAAKVTATTAEESQSKVISSRETKKKEEEVESEGNDDDGDDVDYDPYGGSTDEEMDVTSSRGKNRSGEDTDDEIQRLQAQKLKKVVQPVSPKKINKKLKQEDVDSDDDGVYDVSTDVDEDSGQEGSKNIGTAQKDLLNLASFFSKCHFLLYGSFDPQERRQITRYITAYGGFLENYMADTVTHVISNQKWDSNFDQALKENGSLVFLVPGWVFQCHNQQQQVAPDKYKISN